MNAYSRVCKYIYIYHLIYVHKCCGHDNELLKYRTNQKTMDMNSHTYPRSGCIKFRKMALSVSQLHHRPFKVYGRSA